MEDNIKMCLQDLKFASPCITYN